MTRKEIAADPWKARDKVVEKAQKLHDKIDNIWLSEDGMEEDPEYRKAKVALIDKANRLIDNTLKVLEL